MIAYLLASLPTPRLSEPPTMAPETLVERSRGFVSEERWRDLAAAVVVEHDPQGVRLGTASQRAAGGGAADGAPHDAAARAWRDLSDQIDDAVAIHRGARARRDPAPYLRHPSGYRVDLVEAVERAFEAQQPAARERALDELRWRLADELAASDPDGFAALHARAVQLRLAWRWAAWDTDAGWSVLEATLRELEATQREREAPHA